MKHSDLVRFAKTWLERHHHIVVQEVGAVGCEKPDAIGFKGSGSTLIECKTSRADFLADKNKFFRLHPEFGLGIYRYFLCPAGLITKDEVPARWGLLWLKNDRVFVKRRPEAMYFPETISAEHRFLVSVLRRVSAAGCLELGVSLEARKQHLQNEHLRIEREIRELKLRHFAARQQLEDIKKSFKEIQEA